jgi:hypothetical protein
MIKPTGPGRSPQFLGRVSTITWHNNVKDQLSLGKRRVPGWLSGGVVAYGWSMQACMAALQ